MDNLINVIKEYQKLMNSFPWFENLKNYSNLLFFGGIIAIIANHFLIHKSLLYSIGFYGFLAGALVLLAKEGYNQLSQGFVIYGLYNIVFNVYYHEVVETTASNVPITYASSFNFSNLIEGIIYLAIGYLFYKLGTLSAE